MRGDGGPETGSRVEEGRRQDRLLQHGAQVPDEGARLAGDSQGRRQGRCEVPVHRREPSGCGQTRDQPDCAGWVHTAVFNQLIIQSVKK